jgi:hypothetical protein
MVSYKQLFLVKGMTLWNWTNEKIKGLYQKTRDLCEHAFVYFHRDFNTWYLFTDTLFPLSYRQRFETDIDSTWEYSPERQTLVWKGSNLDQTEYSVSWLSASTVSGKRETDMDTFLSSLRIYTTECEGIPLSILLQAWSIYDKHWWIHSVENRIKWIDEEANEKEVGVRDPHLVPITPIIHSLLHKKN